MYNLSDTLVQHMNDKIISGDVQMAKQRPTALPNVCELDELKDRATQQQDHTVSNFNGLRYVARARNGLRTPSIGQWGAAACRSMPLAKCPAPPQSLEPTYSDF